MAEALPPLSNASCTKCGAPPTAIGLHYRSGDKAPPYGSVARDYWHAGGGECMERRCTLCSFEWLEAPLA